MLLDGKSCSRGVACAFVSEARLIDTDHLGMDRVIGVWECDGVIVDPGPSSAIETVLERLGDGFEPRALLLTHIHLDHAGASGALVERFPSLRVYVHEVGAPHLIDPSKLLKSAARLYGDDMDRLWGEVLPVPEQSVTVLSGGESVEGMRVEYTPGHAHHHVSYLDESSGDLYVGDVGGVRIPPSDEAWIPTPPPDIDIELWDQSLLELQERHSSRLLLTHFGAVDEPAEHLAAVRAGLRTSADRARGAERDEFISTLEARIDEREDEDVGERIRSAMPPEQIWLGLERYWAKREG